MTKETALLRVNYAVTVPVSDEDIRANVAYCRAQGVPFVRESSKLGRKMAVVGGAPTIEKHLDELRNFDGDIYGINDTCEWLIERGIDAIFFTADQIDYVKMGWGERMDKMLRSCKSAVIASTCCQPMMDALQGRVEVITLDPAYGDEAVCIGGYSTSCFAAAMALYMGYSEVHYFGCDCSFEHITHVFGDKDYAEDDLVVRADGKDFRTSLQMLCQCELMAATINAMGGYAVCRSDGLLPAMIADDEWTVIALNSNLHNSFVKQGAITSDKPKYEGKLNYVA